MKTLRIIFLTFLTFFFIQAKTQYITPGNQLSLTLDQLVSLSGGVVTFSNGTYFVNNTLTVAATDTLRITEPAVVRVANGIRLEFSGTLISDPVTGQVIFTAADTTTSATNFKGFRFEDAPANLFRNTVVSYGGGIQLIASDAVFDQCVFRKNGSSNVSAVITYSGCSPVITNNTFAENARSAIGSGANVSGSPHIINNFIYHNTTDNSNRPQINIGPGNADTLYIIDNYIEGFYDNAGGIGISNLIAAGSTKAVIRGNYVYNNRYGFAQIGSNISTIIEHNEFIDNDIQNQPNLGGSGINMQASGSGNTAIIRNNLIKGNLWGITIQGIASPNLGTADDHGENVFYENGNSGSTYALYNNTTNPVSAIGNYWGTNDPAVAEANIFHQPDQAGLGLVTYLPLMTIEPVIESFVFLAAENPGLTTDVTGLIDQQNLTIVLTVPAATNVTAMIPQITLPFAVISDPASGIANDFSQPATYTIITPHGQQAVYTVNVTVEIATFVVTFGITGADGSPVTDAVVNFAGTVLPAGVYVIEGVLPGTYPYEIHHPLYQTAFGELSVVDQPVNQAVQLVPLSWDVSFNVNDQQGNAVTDAVITLNGITNNPGNYLFTALLPGIYSYSVVRNGYATASGEVEVVDGPVTVEVTLELLVYNLAFQVSDAAGLLSDALIELSNGQNQLTDINGEVIFGNLVPGTYTWLVSKSAHASVEGSTEIVDQNVSVVVFLELVPGLNEKDFLTVSLSPNPASGMVSIQTAAKGPFSLQILDAAGALVLDFTSFELTDMIDVSTLKAGTYFVKLQSAEGLKVLRLVRQ